MMANLRLTRVACMAGTIALAACQGDKPATPALPQTATSSYPAPSDADVPPQPAPKKKKIASASSAERQHTPAEKAPDGEITDTDIGVIGLDETRIREMLGDPVSEVDDAPARRLTYRTGTCSVEFALYPDVDTRTYRTLTLEVRNDDGTAKGQRICVADLKSRIEDRRQ